jgi:DNA gyrase/topoisomerase IV subunit B
LKSVLCRRVLLQFDTREFLNALAIAFEDPQFSSQLRQRLVNILIQVMVEGEGFAVSHVLKSQVKHRSQKKLEKN